MKSFAILALATLSTASPILGGLLGGSSSLGGLNSLSSLSGLNSLSGINNINNGFSGNDADNNVNVNAVAQDDGEANFSVEDGDDDGSGDLDANVNSLALDDGKADITVDDDDDVALQSDVQAVDGGKVSVNIGN